MSARDREVSDLVTWEAGERFRSVWRASWPTCRLHVCGATSRSTVAHTHLTTLCRRRTCLVCPPCVRGSAAAGLSRAARRATNTLAGPRCALSLIISGLAALGRGASLAANTPDDPHRHACGATCGAPCIPGLVAPEPALALLADLLVSARAAAGADSKPAQQGFLTSRALDDAITGNASLRHEKTSDGTG